MATPCRPRSPLSRITSPGSTRAGEISMPGGTQPMPAVLMKMPSPLPRSTTLVSPVTIRTPAAWAASRHRRHHAAERFHRQPLFENEARAEIGRLGPGHRQVVDRAADGQRADVAAGEEERTDDEAVGGEGQPGPLVGNTTLSCGGEGRGAGDEPGIPDSLPIWAAPAARGGEEMPLVPDDTPIAELSGPPVPSPWLSPGGRGDIANAGKNSRSIRSRISRPPPPCASCTVAWSLMGRGQLRLKSSVIDCLFTGGSTSHIAPFDNPRKGTRGISRKTKSLLRLCRPGRQAIGATPRRTVTPGPSAKDVFPKFHAFRLLLLL